MRKIKPVAPCHRKHWTCLSCQELVVCDQSSLPLGFCCPRICTGTEERSAKSFINNILATTRKLLSNDFLSNQLATIWWWGVNLPLTDTSLPTFAWGSVLIYNHDLHITFSMIPAPRLWIAFSFLSGSGGLNWIKFFWSKVNGTVTRTWKEGRM